MSTCFDDRVLMKVNDLKCVLHMPPALKSEKDESGKEVEQGLPPYAPRFVFPVDEYPASPTNWMHGSDKVSSYFVPVRKDHGMWLDLNYCYQHKHDVAVVLSIQGLNPITGQKVTALRLEQYKEKCPVHNVEFKQDRYCPECKYKWDAQNYLSTSGTPAGLLWLDGFRALDGIVRQYIFTEETSKGVAAQKIGEDRVYAIGIAFYLSKEPKPVRTSPLRSYSYAPDELTGDKNYCGVLNFTAPAAPPPGGINKNSHSYKEIAKGGILNDSAGVASGGGVEYCAKDIATFKRISIPLERTEALKGAVMQKNPQLLGYPPSNTISPSCRITDSDTTTGFDALEPSADYSIDEYPGHATEQVIEQTHLEIGAGARIRQRIYSDPHDLSYWQDEPIGMIYLNYVDLDTAEKIIEAGRIDTTGGGEGFMNGLEVGK